MKENEEGAGSSRWGSVACALLNESGAPGKRSSKRWRPESPAWVTLGCVSMCAEQTDAFSRGVFPQRFIILTICFKISKESNIGK